MILVGAVVWFFAWQHGNKVMIGDAQKGVAELRPDARYNQDAVLIAEKFALGVDIMNVIAEAGPSACTTSYAAMELIDRFAWHMENVEGVEQVITLPAAAKIVNAGWNDGSVRAGACCRATRTRCARPRRASRPTRACSTPTAARCRSPSSPRTTRPPPSTAWSRR